jgi:hypothetical protein
LGGTSFIVGKYAYLMADSALVMLFRLVIASLFLLPSLVKNNQTTQLEPAIALREFISLRIFNFSEDVHCHDGYLLVVAAAMISIFTQPKLT